MYHEEKKDDQTVVVPYDFSDMTICNSHVALNSFWFCVGLTGKFDINAKIDEHKRKNDKRSLLGIFRFDPSTKMGTIDKWINQYQFQNFYVDDNMTTVMF